MSLSGKQAEEALVRQGIFAKATVTDGTKVSFAKEQHTMTLSIGGKEVIIPDGEDPFDYMMTHMALILHSSPVTETETKACVDQSRLIPDIDGRESTDEEYERDFLEERMIEEEMNAGMKKLVVSGGMKVSVSVSCKDGVPARSVTVLRKK